MRRQAVQRRGAVRQVSGQDHRRRPRDARLGSGGLLRGQPEHPRHARGHGTDRHGLHRARAADSEPERRRVAADQAGPRDRQTAQGKHPLPAGRADHRPQPLRHREAHRPAGRAGEGRELGDRRGARPRGARVLRLDPRAGPGGRRGRRKDHRGGNARLVAEEPGLRHRESTCRSRS